MKTFQKLLVNSLISGVTSSFLWFAITFWVYLETKSVVATSVVGASFALSNALVSMGFGTFVDRHRKHTVMAISTSASLVCYLAAGAVYLFSESTRVPSLRNPLLWLFIFASLFGSVVGNLRSIAFATCVTLLIPEDERDRANGMIGMITGVSFSVTSVFSGLVIGQLGMGWALGLTVGFTAIALLHLLTIKVEEAQPERASDGTAEPMIDISGALAAIRETPGLMGLILFAAMNNLLGGVFFSLMDAYGLSLVSVEAWGLLWGVLSLGFIFGGLIVARRGLGSRPLRLMLIGNAVNWAICTVFAIRHSIVFLAMGMFIWITVMPVVEAAEQTVLQRAVPFERQGRVFGFAQMVENAASPLTSLMIGPLAEVAFIPFMTSGSGADALGSVFGTGKIGGIGLIFSVAGVLGLIATAAARSSRSYRELSRTANA